MNPLDQIPLALVMVAATLIQVAAIEIGFRIGAAPGGKPNKAQMAQVRAIMGASLGLLAFMLAFSFNSAQQHYEERVRAYMLEISAIDSAFRGADLLDDANRRLAQDMLVEFTDLRVQTLQVVSRKEMPEMVEMIRESERLHDRLWSLAERAMEGAGEGEDTGIFAQSILAMISAHDARLQAVFFNRVSPIIWFTLASMALLSMVVTGYQAGLTRTRSQLATWTLAIAFAAVMTLITDLDRPRMSLFSMNQGLMLEMSNRMKGGDSWDPEVHQR